MKSVISGGTKKSISQYYVAYDHKCPLMERSGYFINSVLYIYAYIYI